MKLAFIVIIALIISISSKATKRITCVGASITYGARIEDREHNSFPGQLQQLLGNRYEVLNLGVSGTTMLRKGNNPYWNKNQYQEALKSNPDVVFIDLGGNDSKLINRQYLNEMNHDCQDMIESFRQLPSHPEVVIMLPVVSFVTDSTGIWDPVIVGKVIPGLKNAAVKKGAKIVDMHPLLENHPELMPDNIHPNKEGSAIMARRLFEFLSH